MNLCVYICSWGTGKSMQKCGTEPVNPSRRCCKPSGRGRSLAPASRRRGGGSQRSSGASGCWHSSASSGSAQARDREWYSRRWASRRSCCNRCCSCYWTHSPPCCKSRKAGLALAGPRNRGRVGMRCRCNRTWRVRSENSGSCGRLSRGGGSWVDEYTGEGGGTLRGT